MFMQVREALLAGEWSVDRVASAIRFAALSLQGQHGNFVQMEHEEELIKIITSELPTKYSIKCYRSYFENLLFSKLHKRRKITASM